MFASRNSNTRWLAFIYLICLFIVCFIVYYLNNSKPPSSTENFHEFYSENLPNKLLIKSGSNRGGSNVLFNITDFHYILESKHCSSKIFAVVIVTCYAGDIETRSAVRQAYPERLLNMLGIKRVFLLAQIHKDRNFNNVEESALQNEHDRFGDLVQGSFIEDYKNLTYKHVMGLRWAAESCKEVRYIIKMDSDIVVNFFEIVKMLNQLPHRDIILAGYDMMNMKPLRDPINKWFVTQKEYSHDYYPDFLSGWLYISNPKTAQLLYDTSITVPYFWIDDTYVTGILRAKLNITIARLNKYFTTHPEHLKCCMKQPKYECDFWVGPNGGETKLIIGFEKFAESCFKNQCKRRNRRTSVRNNCIVKWSNDRFGKQVA